MLTFAEYDQHRPWSMSYAVPRLAQKLNELEAWLQNHDGQIIALIDGIRQLTHEPSRRKSPIA